MVETGREHLGGLTSGSGLDNESGANRILAGRIRNGLQGRIRIRKVIPDPQHVHSYTIVLLDVIISTYTLFNFI